MNVHLIVRCSYWLKKDQRLSNAEEEGIQRTSTRLVMSLKVPMSRSAAAALHVSSAEVGAPLPPRGSSSPGDPIRLSSQHL